MIGLAQDHQSQVVHHRATAAKAITEIFGTPVTQNQRGWLAEIRVPPTTATRV